MIQGNDCYPLRVHLTAKTLSAQHGQPVGDHCRLHTVLHIVFRLSIPHQAPATDQLQPIQIGKKRIVHFVLLRQPKTALVVARFDRALPYYIIFFRRGTTAGCCGTFSTAIQDSAARVPDGRRCGVGGSLNTNVWRDNFLSSQLDVRWLSEPSGLRPASSASGAYSSERPRCW